MKKSRILVLEENRGTDKETRLSVLNHTVEFEYRAPGQLATQECDISSYAAVAVPIGNARPDLIDLLSGVQPNSGPVFLYRGVPPLHEVARWVIWGSPSNGGPEGQVADHLLSESLEYYSMASMYQQCLRMMACQDEDSLLSQIAEAFTTELAVESCAVWLASSDDPDEMVIATVRGVIGIDREGSRFPLSQSDIAGAVWTGAPFLVPPREPAGSGGSGTVGSGLYVPLRREEKPIGLVKLGDRNHQMPYSDRDLHMARIIADYAVTALNTLDRLGRIDKISLRDPETGTHSAAFLSDYFEKERYRANRFRRSLSVVFLVVENLSFLTEQTRETVVTGALVSMVDSIRKAVRDSDLLARQEVNRFCIVLPETDAFGAALAVRRFRKSIRGKNRIQFLGADFTLQPFFMWATCPRDGRDLQDLVRVAEEKHARQAKSPLHRMRLNERPFWEAFEILVGKPEFYELLRKGEDVPYFQRIRRDLGRNSHFCMPRENFLRILEATAQEMASCREDRGIVIVAGPTPEIYKQIFLAFQSDSPTRRHIYIVGQAGNTRFDAKNLLYVSADDEMLKDREVILCLKENGAYGLFGTDRGSEVQGFNTADEWLVEAMLEKFQEMYLLQGNF
jgi:diguanylate cyclase (GGDEF)-like protein